MVVALKCTQRQGTYAKAMAASAGAGKEETYIERRYREEIEKRCAEAGKRG